MSNQQATALKNPVAEPQAAADPEALFQPYRLGDLELRNRVVMAPMTRKRAGAGNVPTGMNALYYEQRGSAGLIVTEGTQVSPQGVGYPDTPGLHSAAQVAGWRRVTDTVHGRGGTIFAQLWHVGRVSHPYFHGGALPVAPSALPVEGEDSRPRGRLTGDPAGARDRRAPRHRRQFAEAAGTPTPPASTESRSTAPTAT